MHLLSICSILPIIHAFIIVQIHQNSLYHPLSSCAFIRNASWLNDVSIQSCIWECVNEYDCQTAVYFKDDQICSMFKELCQTGSIQSSTNTATSVICYRKNHEPIISCSSTATSYQRNEESTSVSDMITSTETNTCTPAISTTIIPSITAPGHSCDVIACRSIIAYHISHNCTYNTRNFAECTGCSYANWPNFPADWSDRWYIQDFIIWSSAGQDCTGNPYMGNLTACQSLCLRDATCVGFSRQKNVADTDSTGQCWLKNNIQLNQTPNDYTWHTVIFNATS